MTIFHSEPHIRRTTFVNYGTEVISFMTEPWCQELSIPPGKKIIVTEMMDALDGDLVIDLFGKDGHVSLWCSNNVTIELLDED